MTEHRTHELLVVAEYRVRGGRMENVWSLLGELAEASRQEPGNVSYEPQRHDDSRITIVERYETVADFEVHRTSEHFQRIAVGQIIPLLDSRTVNMYRPLGRSGTRAL